MVRGCEKLARWNGVNSNFNGKYRDGLKSGPVFLSNSQAEKG